MSKYFGRKTPYTERGIARVACSGCGKPSVHQWQACANANRYVTICLDCDIELNRLALTFLKIPNFEELLADYEKQQRS